MTCAVHPSFFDFPFIESPTRILNYLYLGNHNDYSNGAKLKSLGITHSINACPERSRVEFPGITYHYINVADLPTSDILSVIKATMPLIESIRANPENKILINCSMGMSRSVSLTVAHLMYAGKMRFWDAWNYVQSRRYIALPNFGFLYQLKQYEKLLAKPGLTTTMLPECCDDTAIVGFVPNCLFQSERN